MQVPKSSRGCSSSRPEIQDTDTAANMAASVLPQVSRAPGLSRPANPSWLSTYNITRQEETKPVLAIVKQDGFKIEKPGSVPPIPDRLTRYQTNMTQISRFYNNNEFDKAQKTATVLIGLLSNEPETDDLVRYLNTVIFFCHIMQDMPSCLHLPAKHSGEFIDLLMDIADAASKDTADLPASSKLMLYCWRWAADAGGQDARQSLVKALLFRQLCPEMPLPHVHFFPAEASRHLSDMARDDIPLPEPEDHQETAIHKMVELIRLRNTVNFDREKEELVAFFREQPQPEIRLLIPFIYTSDIFGPPEYDKVKEYLEQPRTLDAIKQGNPVIADVHQFWLSVCAVTGNAPAKSVVEKIYQLAQKGFPAAILLLTELSRKYPNTPHEYIIPFIRSCKPHFLEYPHLAYRLYEFYLSNIQLQAIETAYNKTQYGLEMDRGLTQIANDLRIQCDPEARDAFLYDTFQSNFTMDTLRKIGKENIPPLDEKSIRILRNSQYTQDPATLVYLHCAQVLRYGNGDKKLIETAEQKNAFSTCFYMLIMSAATTTMDSVVQIDKLLDFPGVEFQDFLVWKNHRGFSEFLRKLANYGGAQRRNRERCNLLYLDLFEATGGQPCYSTSNLEALAREAIRNDKPAEAEQYFKKIWKLQPQFVRDDAPCEVRIDYQVRRPGLPEYYQQLLSICEVSAHPLETRYRFDQLISVWEKMQENRDPSLWHAWAKKSQNFIRLSCWHLSPEMCQMLIDHCNSVIDRLHRLSIELIYAGIEQLENLVDNALHQGTTDVPHFSVLRQELSCMKQSLTDSYQLSSEACGIDEMAKIPVYSSWNSNVTEQHNVITKIQAAKSIDDVIRYLEGLTVKHEFDSVTLVRIVAYWFKPSVPKAGAGILSVLQQKLNNQLKLLDEIECDLTCGLMWATNNYCQNFSGNLDQTMEDVITRTEQQKTRLFVKKTEQVIKNKGGISGEEKKIFFWINISRSFAEEQDCYPGYLTSLIENLRLYHPRTILRNFFFKDTRRKKQCVSYLRVVMGKKPDIISCVKKFLGYHMKGEQTAMASFLDNTLKAKTLSDKEKGILLWYACESSLITDDLLARQLTNLNKQSPWYSFLEFLLEDNKHAIQLNKLESFSQITSSGRHYQDAVGFKLFSLGRLDDAADIWSAKYQSAYPLAMLAWHHDIQPRTQSVDIEQQLLAAAKDAQVKAQCELIHWLMKRQKEGKKINDRQVAVACRFVHTPNPMAGGESILYQGITQYIGFGCDVDLKAGMEKIQEALDEDPLAVSLRLYDLKEQGLFVLPDDPPTDYLLHYAQALSERDHDPFNRRDNYPANLLLSYGRNKLQKLLASLRDGASSPSAHPAYQKAADRLDSWLDQWQKGAALPASASPEMPEATALPASAPQETPRATVSSTRASRKKSGAPASSASASRKKSRATASSRKAPAKPLEVTACTKKDVEQVLNRATEDNWQTATLCEMDELTRKLRSGSKTGLDVEIQEELYNLLDAMPLTSRELAEHADTIVDYISRSELVTEIVTNWMMKLYFGSDFEKAFLTERIVKALPAALPISMAVENKDDIGNEEEPENKEDIENKENVVNKENVMRFLELLIQYQPMPEAVRYLWDALSAEDRAHLLLQGLPDGIDKNPVMYQQHVETVQSPDPVLVDGIWRALNPASDARLIQATLAALITQNSSELQVMKADDGRLKGIDLYTLFAGCNTAQRKTLLGCHSILDGGLIKSYIEKHRRNPGKSVPLKHLPGTIESALDNERKKSTKERDLLDLLIQAQDNSSSIRPDLLQAFSSKAKAMAVETMKKSIDSSEQQNARLTALAISFLVS